MVRGVVFDLDGTLLDTLDDILAVGRGVENLVWKLLPHRSRDEEYVKRLSD